MFGWEFPPFNTGGLGTACYGLTKSLAKQNCRVKFVLPKMPRSVDAEYVDLVSADMVEKIDFEIVQTPLTPYMKVEEYHQALKEASLSPTKGGELYGKNLFEEVYRYGLKGGEIALRNEHDVIHAHDWMTYKAGMAAKRASGKPLIVHVHATEFDRTGGNGVNQNVYDLEREGMHAADKIIAVSNFCKDKVIEHYGISPDKVTVVHNGVEFDTVSSCEAGFSDKTVLFLGRVTLQKGPDYFVYAAHKVLQVDPEVNFVVAGNGDMLPSVIEKAAELGIADKFFFTGFLRGKDVDRAYKMAKVYVMPSVSEPFGITPLEAMRNGVPVIISKQSGVSEVISHCLKCDFWDVNELAQRILGVLEHSVLHEEMQMNGSEEVLQLSWDEPASKCIEVYQSFRTLSLMKAT